MKLLGQPFSKIRNIPTKRPFTRGANKVAYLDALLRLEYSHTVARVKLDGIAETNGESNKELAAGAMKLIASADKLLVRHEDTSVLCRDVVNDLNEAARSFHFAGNTLRRMQQFEMAADFYWISARIGLAAALHESATRNLYQTLRSPDGKTSLLGDLWDFSDRSYMRASAVMKETGSDDRRRAIFTENRELRRLFSGFKAGRDDPESAGSSILLLFWKILSGYGTNLPRLVLAFVCYIYLFTVLQCAVFHNVPNVPNILDMFVETFNLTLRGGRLEKIPHDWQKYFDVILRAGGVFWLILLGQAIVQRISFRS